MMEARKKILILLSLGVLLLLAFIILFLVLKKDAPGVPTESTPTSNVEAPVEETPVVPQPVVVPNTTPPPPPETTEERERLYVRQLARTFTERVETYSNQNDNRNIEDVLPLVTAGMESYVKTKAQEQSGAYQGVTTRVISMEVVSFDGASATVNIGAQQEFTATGTSKTEYKNGRVELQKIGGVWKISGLFWE